MDPELTSAFVMRRRKFQLEGGRAGFVSFREGRARGQLEWEMLVGDVSMVIYSRSCWWLEPAEVRMHPDEVCRLSQELANEMRIAIELASPEGSEVVRPGSGE
jgi:hypothetical protein